jgi:hypothetical protein
MPIEAPISKHKKNNFYIYIAVCLAAAIWLSYDGYLNKSFINKHTDENGNPNNTLIFNQKAPPVFAGAAIILGIYLYRIRDSKLLADENELVISDKKRIPYNSIQQIDKTHFEEKGYFTITYKNSSNEENTCKLSSDAYDNLNAVLDRLVTEIS